MTTTTHLGITHLQAGTAAAEVVVNTALDTIDAHIAANVPDSSLGFAVFDDYTGGTLTNSSPFVNATAGAGSGVALTGASEAGHPGIAVLSCGTTTTGNASLISKSDSCVVFGSDTWRARIIFKTPAALSDGTDRYTLRIGFGDSTAGADPVDGVFLRYCDNVNSGKFECVTRANSTETVDDSGVTVAASTWYRLDIEVNEDASEATFTLKVGTADPVEVGSITTNIPTGSTRASGFQVSILKSLGTTNRDLGIDRNEMAAVFGAPR